MLVERIRDYTTEFGVPSRGDRVGVAVSGGPDSIALLHLLFRLREELEIELAVLHLDHGLRPSSAEDHDFVEEEASRLGIEFHSERADLSPASPSLEDLARRARYTFFDRIAEAAALDHVATGHTADDNLETFLYRLIRGSSRSGLSAIPPRRRAGRYSIIRPLIRTRREEIISFLRSERLEWREDPMNSSLVFERNRIRHQMIPYLREKFNPGLFSAVSKAIEVFREEDDLLDGMASEAFDDAKIEVDSGVSLSLERLRTLHPSILRRVLRKAVFEAGGGAVGADYTKTLLLTDLVSRKVSGRLSMGEGLTAAISEGLLTVRSRSPERPLMDAFEEEVLVPGITHISPLGVRVETLIIEDDKPMVKVEPGSETVFADLDSITLPLTVRTRRPGDYMTPFGMKGGKKLKNLFNDEKVPRGERDRIPVLADATGIVWVVGVRQDERTRVTEKTTGILRLTVRRSPEDEPAGEIA